MLFATWIMKFGYFCLNGYGLANFIKWLYLLCVDGFSIVCNLVYEP